MRSDAMLHESDAKLTVWKSWHWGPPPVKRSLTSQPHPSPPRRRHCAQVRFRSIRVATTCEFPHPFFRARVDHHPTHHPPPPQIGPVGPTNQQGPRARVDARLARAPLGRLDSCNPRARRTRRFEVGRRRSAHVRVERRVSRRSSYHFTHPPKSPRARLPSPRLPQVKSGRDARRTSGAAQLARDPGRRRFTGGLGSRRSK